MLRLNVSGFPSRKGLILAAIACFAITANAQTVLSNLATSSGGSNTVNSGNFYAGIFTTSASGSFSIDTVILKMSNATDTSGNFQVSIYTDDGSGAHPVSVVSNGILAGTANPATAGNYTFTATNLTLAASTNYWVVAGVTTGTGAYKWNFATGATFQTTVWTSAGTLDFTPSGGAAPWNSFGGGNPAMYSINVTAVPEPAVVGAILGCTAIGVALRRRRAAGAPC